jgi:hypothetical protein
MQNKRLKAFLKNLGAAPAKALKAEAEQMEANQPQHWAHISGDDNGKGKNRQS